MAQKEDDPLDRALSIAALIMFGPLIALLGLAQIVEAIRPALPMLLIIVLAAGSAFVFHKYRTSPYTIRREHEREVLALLAEAERKQASLPRSLEDADIRRAIGARIPLDPSLMPAVTPPAQAIYADEFLRMLPPMPGVPLEGERVYDIDYDRRTLKKGEEPPYRVRTDAKGRPTSLALEEFKAFLHRYVASVPSRAEAVTLFVDTYADFVAALFADVPQAPVGAAPFTVPLIELAAIPGKTLTAALRIFWATTVTTRQHFSTVRETFSRNRERLSASLLKERELGEGKLVNPDRFSGTTGELLNAYLDGTGLAPLFTLPIPFAIPTAKRFEGHWIVARQGAGKTNALECLIHADLAEVAEGRASVLVMDSQGMADDTLLGRLSTLKTFAPGQPLDGRLIYLEPDLDYPLALNLFDIGLADMGSLSASQREDIVSSATEVVEFLFTGLLGGELSDNMTMVYKYLVPAMLVIPDADMSTFIDLLDTASTRDKPIPEGYRKYRQHLFALEPEILSFLETDFQRDPELVRTKAAVRRRLRAAMADATFRRMFMQPRNKLNLFHELQSGKVILVNTYAAKSYVEPFGRLILALLMQATRQRLEIDRDRRMPTYVYVDECQDYIANEERIARYIDKCRKQNVGLIFANQRLSAIENPKVRNALSGMATKFAGTSDADSAELAGLTVTDSHHIRQLPKGTFAGYVSGITPRGIDLKFPLSPLERAERMSRTEWDRIRRQMRDRYAVPYHAAGQASASARPETPSTASDDIVDADFTEVSEAEAPSLRLLKPPRDPDDYDPLQ